MSLSVIATGSFKNVASTPFYLPLSQHVSRFDLMNLSQLSSYTSGRITNVTWYDYMTAGTAIIDAPTTVTGPLNTSAVIRTYLASNGITAYDSSQPATYPVKVVASYVPSTTATTLLTVWTSTAHGYQVGDNVRIYGLTTLSGSNQFNGYVQTVVAVTTDTFSTMLNTNGGTTSTGSVQKVGNVAVQNSALYFPQNRVIAGITNANPMVVTTLVPQNYQVGDVVTFLMPSVFGMSPLQANTRGVPFLATVTAANNAVGTQTVTFGGVDSSYFGTFSALSATGWPASSSSPFSPPVLVPNNRRKY